MKKIIYVLGVLFVCLMSAFVLADCSVCDENCTPCDGGCTATDMSGMYMGVTDFDNVVGDITSWNTSCITSMTSMLRGTDFNQDISGWDTSSVTDMSGMFIDTPTFNQPIGSWDVGQVTDMNAMFAGATSFNQNLSNWNTISVTTMGNMFNGDTDFNGDITNWNTGQVMNMENMFLATSFNQDISGWDTSQVTNMAGMFRGSDFNQDISGWDTSQVTNITWMFLGSVYNQPIGSWNTSQVTDMSYMFNNDHVFNQDISGWDTSHVTSMRGIFSGDWAFDQPIGSWNTSSVTDMYGMFIASNFNQDISGWDTSQVTDMGGTFALSNFNKDISSWDIGNVLSMFNMFNMVTLSTENYDSILLGWSNQSVQDNVTFNAGSSQYSWQGKINRDILTDLHGWVITDGGEISYANPSDPGNFHNDYGSDWGTFPYIYDKEMLWDASNFSRTNISYSCRDVSYGVIGCDNFDPTDNVTYDFEYTDDDGANWYISTSGDYDYQLYGGWPTYPGWGTYTTLMFKTEDFPIGIIKLRIRAFDGFNYSNWVESDNITNHPSNWSCIAYNESVCILDNYKCLMATDLNGYRGNMTWEWNDPIFLANLQNKTPCENCTPNWNCSSFGSCVANVSECLAVEDLNTCGDEFDGNLSDYNEACVIPPTPTERYNAGDLVGITGDFLTTIPVKARPMIPIFILGMVAVAISGMAVMGVKMFKK